MAEKMKGIVFVGPQKVEIQEFDKPKIRANEVLLKMRTVALCTMEQRTFRGTGGKYPSVSGHEVCAEIVEVG